ncbi:hypothetical protein FACS1894188_03810 [Clostridia bacterium]|nr:hypothetical protein FACS1894188_03810 [Clostridia bacterium]
MPELLEKVKVSLRVSGDVFDSELTDLIASARGDLARVGIVAAKEDMETDETRPLVHRAVILYCKGYFGYEENSEKFVKAYERLRDSLSMTGGYCAD